VLNEVPVNSSSCAFVRAVFQRAKDFTFAAKLPPLPSGNANLKLFNVLAVKVVPLVSVDTSVPFIQSAKSFALYLIATFK
jgi:hypothetical protein